MADLIEKYQHHLPDNAAWVTPQNNQQLKVPLRVGFAMAVGVILWVGSYLGLVGVLIPAKIAEIAPGQKATIVAVMSAVAMVISTIANILEGALSDRTRSRLGRRTPWLLFGSAGSFAVILVWGQVTTVAGIIICAGVYQLFLNALVAPLIAVLADRVAPRHRGTISSMYAVGNSTGVYGGQIIAASFLTSSYTGFIVMACMALASGPVAALIMREGSSKGMSVAPITKTTLFQQFAFPLHNARDYYLALFGKLFIMTSKFVIAGYQLYILTDYMVLNATEAASYIKYVSSILLISSVVLAIFSGPLADKLQLRKWPVVIAGIIIALGCFLPSLAPDPRLMVAYALVAGIGMGIFTSVDQALNIEVLPDPRNAAKDLGVLNIANNGGQILGPVIAGVMINFVGYHAIFIGASVAALFGAFLISLIRKVK